MSPDEVEVTDLRDAGDREPSARGGSRRVTVMVWPNVAGVYQPLTLAGLGELLTGTDETSRWRLVAEFLEEYRWDLPGPVADAVGVRLPVKAFIRQG